jgi:hypothetical protein
MLWQPCPVPSVRGVAVIGDPFLYLILFAIQAPPGATLRIGSVGIENDRRVAKSSASIRLKPSR